jgi:hypothetical protein
MGRPLKIQKYGTAQGITYNADGTANTPAAGVAVDAGYPNFGSLTDPEYNSADTLNSTQFYGVVGGAKSSALSATFPIVKCEVYITDSSSGQTPGVILRQKGSHKYLVATTASIDPANAVAGVALRITAVGDTDWAAMGLTGTAAIGTIFTPTAAAGAGTSGTAQEVGQCVLTSDLSPTAGLMSISYFTGDSTEVAISKLTNKYLLNWSTFQNAGGTSLTTYADGGNNLGEVVYSGEGQYLTNFFTDEGTATKSGSEDNSTLSIAIVENYTS